MQRPFLNKIGLQISNFFFWSLTFNIFARGLEILHTPHPQMDFRFLFWKLWCSCCCEVRRARLMNTSILVATWATLSATISTIFYVSVATSKMIPISFSQQFSLFDTDITAAIPKVSLERLPSKPLSHSLPPTKGSNTLFVLGPPRHVTDANTITIDVNADFISI